MSIGGTVKLDTCFKEDIRVRAARSIQAARFVGVRSRDGGAAAVNAAMRDIQVRKYCPLVGPGRALLERAVERLGLSARGVGRIRKVARTIADLDGRDAVRPGDLAEAIQYRR